jgi:hypothetical protein
MDIYNKLKAEAWAIYAVEANTDDYNTRAVALAKYNRALGAALEAMSK